MKIDQKRVEDAIIKEVSANIISDESLWDKAKAAFDVRVEKLWEQTVEDRLNTAVEEAIKVGFDREYQRVNSFGQQGGEKTTIRAQLENLVGDYWNASVDNNGKPSTSTYSKQCTRAEWLMTQLVAKDFNGDMKQHVTNLGGSLKDALRAELHETVNRLLADVFKVRSLDDQGKNRNDSSSIHPHAKPTAS